MVRHYNLTMDGTIQRLSDVLPVNEGDLLKYIALSAETGNANLIFIGSFESQALAGRTLSSTDYGWRQEIPVTGIPTAPDIIEIANSTYSLAEFVVLGTAPDVLHIITIK